MEVRGGGLMGPSQAISPESNRRLLGTPMYTLAVPAVAVYVDLTVRHDESVQVDVLAEINSVT
eukprot:269063-Prymnesium_polylepis.1